MDEFKGIVDTQHPHVLCIVKTLLSDDISDSDIALQGYQILYLEQKQTWWGYSYMKCLHNSSWTLQKAKNFTLSL